MTGHLYLNGAVRRRSRLHINGLLPTLVALGMGNDARRNVDECIPPVAVHSVTGHLDRVDHFAG